MASRVQRLKLSTLASVGTVMLQSSEVLFTHTPVGGLAPRMRAIHQYAHLTLSVHTLSSVTPSIALLPHNKAVHTLYPGKKTKDNPIPQPNPLHCGHSGLLRHQPVADTYLDYTHLELYLYF